MNSRKICITCMIIFQSSPNLIWKLGAEMSGRWICENENCLWENNLLSFSAAAKLNEPNKPNYDNSLRYNVVLLTELIKIDLAFSILHLRMEINSQ